MQNDVLDIGRILRDGVDHVIAESLLLIVPIETGTQFVWGILHEARQDVFSGRSDGWVGQRWNDHVNVGMTREVAVLGIVVCLFHVFNAGRDRNRTAQVSARSRHALEIRQRIQREIHLS